MLTDKQKEFILKFDSLGALMKTLGRKKIDFSLYKEIIQYWNAYKDAK